MVIVAALAVGSMIFFRVDSIEVSGSERYTAQEVIAASGIQQGDGLITLNRERIAMQILQKLPYVDQVNIRPSLPQTVRITVSESGAVACIECEGTLWLMNYRGKILGTAEGEAAVARITGLTPLRPTAGTALQVGETEKTKLQSLLELLSALKQEGLLEGCSEFDFTFESRITFLYDGRYTVKLPMTTDWGKKMRALSQVVTSERIGERGTIDFTIEEAPHYIPQS